MDSLTDVHNILSTVVTLFDFVHSCARSVELATVARPASFYVGVDLVEFVTYNLKLLPLIKSFSMLA